MRFWQTNLAIALIFGATAVAGIGLIVDYNVTWFYVYLVLAVVLGLVLGFRKDDD